MRTVIVFTSQTGFTRRYAEHIANRLGCPIVDLADDPRFDPEGHDTVVFCGWFHAATLKGAGWAKRAMTAHPKTTFVIVGVGATPMPCDLWPESGHVAAFRRSFPETDYPDLAFFYAQGGFDFNRLKLPDKLAMRLFFKMQRKEAETNPQAADMLRHMESGYFDAVDFDSLEPLFTHLSRRERPPAGAGQIVSSADRPSANDR